MHTQFVTTLCITQADFVAYEPIWRLWFLRISLADSMPIVLNFLVSA